MAAAVRGTDRTLDIFETFARVRTPLSLKQLTNEVRIPASTCHGIAQTLLQRGYLYLLSQRKQLYPTRRIWTLANSIVSCDPLVERVRPAAEWLRDQTGETILVGE